MVTRSLLTGCPRCDEHGPDEYPPLTFSLNLDERRTLHRATHEPVRPFLDLLARVVRA